MQAEYKKEWMDTYLWVLPEKQNENPYIEQMLLHNQGEGRLEFSKQQKDGEEYYCYKVTGKKALNSIYAMLPIGERQIRNILRQLFRTLENGKEYLLSEEDFVLSPTYIFAEFPQMELSLCYVPGYGVPLKEQLEGLFEYLLNRVDYGDKNAVELLYDCYMFCMKESGGLEEIRAKIEQIENEEVEKEEIQDEKGTSLQEDGEERKQQEKPYKTTRSGKQENRSKNILYKEPEAEEKMDTTGSYFTWLSEKLFHRKRKEISRELPLAAEEGEIYETVSKEEEEEVERTVLLASVKKEEGLLLINSRTGEITRVDKFPFYIGVAEGYVDFMPKGDGVSRIHCCISKKGANYYVSDLNSTNGTYLDEREVLPGTEVLLSANAELRITSENFYIKFPCH